METIIKFLNKIYNILKIIFFSKDNHIGKYVYIFRILIILSFICSIHNFIINDFKGFVLNLLASIINSCILYFNHE